MPKQKNRSSGARTKSLFTQDNLKKFIDKSIYLAAIMAIAMTLPQLIKIWSEKNTEGVSLLTWIGFAIGSIFWFLYGFLHNERPIMFTNGVLFFIQLFIVIGILLFTPNIFASF